MPGSTNRSQSGHSVSSFSSAPSRESVISRLEDGATSELMEWGEGVVMGSFGVLFTIVKERYNTGLRFLLVKLVLDFCQLFTVVFKPNDGWVIDQDLWLWKALRVLQFEDFIKTRGYTIFLIALYSMIALIVLAVALASWVAWCFQHRNFPFVWPIKLLRVYANIFFNVLDVATLTLLQLPFDCHWLGYPSNIRNRLSIFPSVTCSDMPHVAHMTAAGVALAVFLVMAFMNLMADFELNPTTRHMYATANSLVEVRAFCLKFLMTVVSYGIGWNKVQSILQLLFSTYLTWMYLKWQPHLFDWVNHVRVGLNASIAVTALGAAVLAFRREEPQHFRRTVTTTFLAMIGPIMFVGALASYIRLTWWTKYVLMRYRTAPTGQKARRIYKFNDSREVEIVARVCRKWTDQHYEVLDRVAAKEAEIVIKGGMQLFPNDAFMIITYANLLIDVLESTQTGYSQLQAAKKCSPNLMERFAIFAREQEHMQRASGAKSGESSVDLVSYVEYQRNHRLVMRAHRQALVAIRHFWQLLLHNTVTFTSLAKALHRIEKSVSVAESFYRTALIRYPASPKLLRGYAKFLEAIKNNPWRAAKYFSEAEKLQDMQQQDEATMAVMGAEEGGMGGSGTHLLHRVDERVNIVFLINSAGIIQMANKNACSLLGYGKGELDGKNINVIMPPPFSQRHNRYIRQYIQTGRERVISSINSVVALHKARYVLPVKLAVSKVSGATEDSIFMGVLEPVPIDPAEAHLYILPNGVVTAMDQAFAEWMGFEMSDILGQDVATLVMEPGQLKAALPKFDPIAAARLERQSNGGVTVASSAAVSPAVGPTLGKLGQMGFTMGMSMGLGPAAAVAPPPTVSLNAVTVGPEHLPSVQFLHKYTRHVDCSVTLQRLGIGPVECMVEMTLRRNGPAHLLALTGPSGRVRYIASELARALGTSPSALYRQPLGDIMPQPWGTLHSTWIKSVGSTSTASTGAPVGAIVPGSCRSGITMVLGSSLRMQGYYRLAISSDEDSGELRHVMEAQPSTREAALSERRLMLTVDADGVVTEVDDGPTWLYGFAPSQVLGRSLADVVTTLKPTRAAQKGADSGGGGSCAEDAGALGEEAEGDDVSFTELLSLLISKAMMQNGVSWRVGVTVPTDEQELAALGPMRHAVMSKRTTPAIMEIEVSLDTTALGRPAASDPGPSNVTGAASGDQSAEGAATGGGAGGLAPFAEYGAPGGAGGGGGRMSIGGGTGSGRVPRGGDSDPSTWRGGPVPSSSSAPHSPGTAAAAASLPGPESFGGLGGSGGGTPSRLNSALVQFAASGGGGGSPPTAPRLPAGLRGAQTRRHGSVPRVRRKSWIAVEGPRGGIMVVSGAAMEDAANSGTRPSMRNLASRASVTSNHSTGSFTGRAPAPGAAEAPDLPGLKGMLQEADGAAEPPQMSPDPLELGRDLESTASGTRRGGGAEGEDASPGPQGDSRSPSPRPGMPTLRPSTPPDTPERLRLQLQPPPAGPDAAAAAVMAEAGREADGVGGGGGGGGDGDGKVEGSEGRAERGGMVNAGAGSDGGSSAVPPVRTQDSELELMPGAPVGGSTDAPDGDADGARDGARDGSRRSLRAGGRESSGTGDFAISRHSGGFGGGPAWRSSGSYTSWPTGPNRSFSLRQDDTSTLLLKQLLSARVSHSASNGPLDAGLLSGCQQDDLLGPLLPLLVNASADGSALSSGAGRARGGGDTNVNADGGRGGGDAKVAASVGDGDADDDLFGDYGADDGSVELPPSVADDARVVIIRVSLWRADLLTPVVEVDSTGAITAMVGEDLAPPGLLFGVPTGSLMSKPLHSFLHLQDRSVAGLFHDPGFAKRGGLKTTAKEANKVGSLREVTGVHSDSQVLDLTLQAVVKESAPSRTYLVLKPRKPSRGSRAALLQSVQDLTQGLVLTEPMDSRSQLPIGSGFGDDYLAAAAAAVTVDGVAHLSPPPPSIRNQASLRMSFDSASSRGGVGGGARGAPGGTDAEADAETRVTARGGSRGRSAWPAGVEEEHPFGIAAAGAGAGLQPPSSPLHSGGSRDEFILSPDVPSQTAVLPYGADRSPSGPGAVRGLSDSSGGYSHENQNTTGWVSSSDSDSAGGAGRGAGGDPDTGPTTAPAPTSKAAAVRSFFSPSRSKAGRRQPGSSTKAPHPQPSQHPQPQPRPQPPQQWAPPELELPESPQESVGGGEGEGEDNASELSGGSGVSEVLDASGPTADYRRGKRYRKLLKVLESPGVQRAARDFQWQALLANVAQLLSNLLAFILLTVLLQKQARHVGTLHAATSVNRLMHESLIIMQKLSNHYERVYPSARYYTAEMVPSLASELKYIIGDFSSLVTDIYTGIGNHRRQSTKSYDPDDPQDIWNKPIHNETVFYTTTPYKVEYRHSTLWDMSSSFVERASEVQHMHGTWGPEHGTLTDYDPYRWSMTNGLGPLYEGFSDALLQLTHSAIDDAAAVNRLQLVLLVLQGCVVCVLLLIYMWWLQRRVSQQRYSMYALFMMVPVGLLRALASKSVNVTDNSDAEASSDGDNGDQLPGGGGAGGGGDAAAGRASPGFNLVVKNGVTSDRAGSSFGISRFFAWMGRGAGSGANLSNAADGHKTSSGGGHSHSHSHSHKRRQLVPSNHDSAWLLAPFVVWGVLICVLYAVGYVLLKNTTGPLALLSAHNIAVVRMHRLLSYSLQLNSLDDEYGKLQLQALLRRELRSFEVEWDVVLYGANATTRQDRRFDLCTASTAFSDAELSRDAFRLDGCLAKAGGVGDLSLCLQPSDQFYSVTTHGIDMMVERMIEDVSYLVRLPTSRLTINSTHLDYIMLHGQGNIEMGMEAVANSLISSIDSLYSRVGLLQIFSLVLSWLLAVAFIFFQLRPFVAANRLETQRIARMLSELPPELDIEGIVTRVLLRDSGNSAAQQGGSGSVASGRDPGWSHGHGSGKKVV